jgi:Mlc titration factor MtfA (ptsG expression regulator)
MTPWLVTLAAIALFGALLVLGPGVLRRVARAAARRPPAPVPAEWRATVERQVPAVGALDEDQRTRLLRAARDLVTTRTWEGCGGLALTRDMQLVIAAQACLLTFERPGDPYPTLRSILVYPRTFVPRPLRDLRKWLASSDPERAVPELGEAWSGVVVLAWDDAVAGAADPGDGQNIVFHEFAHQLDFEHHLTSDADDLAALMDGEVSPVVADPETWQRVLQESYDGFCGRLERGEPAVLDAYAATDPGEFFAVATEVFFEQPRALRSGYADLYEQLRTFYRQDPAGRSST